MTQITLNIDDDKINVFLEYIKTLNYVSITTSEEIPQWQINEVMNVVHDIDAGYAKTEDWETVKDRLQTKYIKK